MDSASPQPTPSNTSQGQSNSTPGDSQHWDELSGPERARSPLTKQVMSTALYRSWGAFMHSANRLDDEEFSSRTRAQLQSLGSSFLTHVLRRAPIESQIPEEIDLHLRSALKEISFESVDAFILNQGAPSSTRQAQLRSVLRTLVRPWLASENILNDSALPAPAITHPADAYFGQLFFAAACSHYLEQCQTAGTLSKGTASNVMRILHRFLRFTYDAALESALDHGPKGSGLPLNVLEEALCNNFDNLVERFSSCVGPDAPQTSRAAASSARSALTRHIRPLILGEALAPRISLRPSGISKAAPSKKPVAGGTETDSGQELGQLMAPAHDSPSDNANSAISERPVTAEEFADALERAVSAVADYTKSSRVRIAEFGPNGIRKDQNEVRILLPPLNERTPPTWLKSSDPTLLQAIDAYVALLRRCPTIRRGSRYFVTFTGDPIALPTPSPHRRKGHKR